jgi:hypothetical protein
MRIENTALASLTCEKILANHQPEYLPKGSEKLGPMKVEIVKTPSTRKRK